MSVSDAQRHAAEKLGFADAHPNLCGSAPYSSRNAVVTGSRAARGNDLRAGIVQQRAAGEPAGEDGLLAAVGDNTAKISAADRLAAAARDRGAPDGFATSDVIRRASP